MLYYKVKPENDNKRRFKFKRGGGLILDGIFIENELYTANEIKKYPGAVAFCDRVEIPKNKIYFFFGARFDGSKQ